MQYSFVVVNNFLVMENNFFVMIRMEWKYLYSEPTVDSNNACEWVVVILFALVALVEVALRLSQAGGVPEGTPILVF